MTTEPMREHPRVPGTMRAVTVRRYGPPEVLRVERLPVPTPESGEVLVRVDAVSVSRAETAMRAARPAVARLATGLRRPRNPVAGSELVGEVVLLGTGTTGLQVGDRVVGVANVAVAEYACAPAAGLAQIPRGLSAPEAVALTEGGLTALPFLRDTARLRAGQRVCVNGAVGSVGAAAVQLAVAMGAEVTAVCSGRNAELALGLGAARVVDYTTEDVTARTDTFDVFFDAVGTLSFRQARRSLHPGGIYLSTVPTAGIAWHTLTAAAPGARRRGRIALTGLRRPEQKAADLGRMIELANQGLLRPVLDRTYSFAEAAAAHAYVETGRKRGTVVLVP